MARVVCLYSRYSAHTWLSGARVCDCIEPVDYQVGESDDEEQQ